jgi:hypothetical protein
MSADFLSPAPRRSSSGKAGNRKNRIRLSAEARAELGNFFEVLSASLTYGREEERKKNRPQSARKPSGRPGTSGRRMALLLTGLAAAILVAATPALLAPHPVPLPRKLVGYWHGADGAYRDHGFALSRDTVIVDPGDADSALSYPIERVLTRDDPKGKVYTIEYGSEGRLRRLVLRYEAGPPEAVRLVHRPEVEWVKSDQPGPVDPS